MPETPQHIFRKCFCELLLFMKDLMRGILISHYHASSAVTRSVVFMCFLSGLSVTRSVVYLHVVLCRSSCLGVYLVWATPYGNRIGLSSCISVVLPFVWGPGCGMWTSLSVVLRPAASSKSSMTSGVSIGTQSFCWALQLLILNVSWKLCHLLLECSNSKWCS
jgi:hypothetical protein